MDVIGHEDRIYYRYYATYFMPVVVKMLLHDGGSYRRLSDESTIMPAIE